MTRRYRSISQIPQAECSTQPKPPHPIHLPTHAHQIMSLTGSFSEAKMTSRKRAIIDLTEDPTSPPPNKKHKIPVTYIDLTHLPDENDFSTSTQSDSDGGVGGQGEEELAEVAESSNSNSKFPKEETKEEEELRRAEKVQNGTGEGGEESKKTKTAKNLFRKTKGLKMIYFRNPESKSCRRRWWFYGIKSTEDFKKYFGSLLDDEATPETTNLDIIWDYDEHDGEPEPWMEWILQYRIEPWRQLIDEMRSNDFGIHVKCRIGIFKIEFHLFLNHLFTYCHMPNFQPHVAKFVWQQIQRPTTDIGAEMTCPEEILQFRHWPRRFFHENCLPMEKVTRYFERGLEKRVAATERLQYDLIEKPLMLRLKDSNVVNMVLEYISPMELPCCYFSK